MKPLKLSLSEQAKSHQVPIHVIEKDYALSYVLAGISQQKDLAETLVFKGGTALKKMYFGNYRFSEDLDFSTRNSLNHIEWTELLNLAIQSTQQMLTEYGPFTLTLRRKTERAPHPFGQDAFIIAVQYPWHRTPQCQIKIEITNDELVILPPISRSIIHDYNEPLDAKTFCYPLEEIIAEKMRALLQTHQKLISRGWNRPRARDYYDLWRIFRDYQSHINLNQLSQTLRQKCKHRQVTYKSINDFFTPALIDESHKHWQSNLANFVVGLPPVDQVLDEVRQMISKALPSLELVS